MKNIIFTLFLFFSLNSHSENLLNQNSAPIPECSPVLEVKKNIALTGICHYGNYQIEFFKHLKAATLHLCNDSPYCGVQADWKGADSYIDTVVKDSNGNIVATNLVKNIDAILLNSSSFRIPYLVLQSKKPGSSGSGNYFHIYSAFPEFHKVGKIGPLWDSKKGIYVNERNNILVDVRFKNLPPDIPSLANGISYPITMKINNSNFEPALEHMRGELKVFSQDDLININSKAKIINTRVKKIIFNPDNELKAFELNNPGFMLNEIYQLGFMRTIVELVREGRIDLAWDFFDLAIPYEYDSRQDFNLPMYKNKKIMKQAINDWLTTLEHWDLLKELNNLT